ncbi:MAG: hypothetical protein EPO26_17700 [Chloroflexota bacterium]|nr:MAG: hypothetical protein EPO26_17700 [Chloroflexota bacterium]
MAKVKVKVGTDTNSTSRVARTEGVSVVTFGLIDVESGNMVGSFCSEREALLAVAATAREHGAASDAVLSLSLFRWDVPAEQGFIADGADLLQRAVSAGGGPADRRAR